LEGKPNHAFEWGWTWSEEQKGSDGVKKNLFCGSEDSLVVVSGGGKVSNSKTRGSPH